MPDLFHSFFLGGFECSTHRRRDGERLDMVAASRHDRFAAADYARCMALGIRTVREGIRWNRIETRPGRYDFSGELPRIRAARDTGVQVIWDLFHYGWPDDLDIFRPEFGRRLARLSRAFAEVIASETDAVPYYAPVNEISFVAWAGGEVQYLNPFANGRGHELKDQLVRAVIEATEAVWEVDPRARIVQIDPVINIVADPERPQDRDEAAGHTRSQYDAWDMIAGRQRPELGGAPRYLDIIGVNFYDRNQRIHHGRALRPGDPLYRPFREMLREVYERYRRPLLVAETGAEGELRPLWLRYIGHEVRAALRTWAALEGLCLYPIVNHPGWDDGRHCLNGLWDYADNAGAREVYAPLLRELRRQERLLCRERHPDRAPQSMSAHSSAGPASERPRGGSVLVGR